MIKRFLWRLQMPKQYRKRQRRKREMWERHEAFKEYVESVKRKKGKQ